MKIEFNLNDPAEVAAVQTLLGNHSPAASPVAAAPAATAPAPAPRPAAPAPNAPAPTPAPAPTQPAPAPTPAPAPAPSASAPTGAVSADQFAAQVQNYAKTHGPKAAKAKFAEHGYTKISDVPAEYIPFMFEQFAV